PTAAATFTRRTYTASRHRRASRSPGDAPPPRCGKSLHRRGCHARTQPRRGIRRSRGVVAEGEVPARRHAGGCLPARFARTGFPDTTHRGDRRVRPSSGELPAWTVADVFSERIGWREESHFCRSETDCGPCNPQWALPLHNNRGL